MPMIVQKFGGSSLGDAERIGRAADIIARQKDVIVVLSAMQGVTDLLFEAADAAEKGEGYAALFQRVVEKYSAAAGSLPHTLSEEAQDALQSFYTETQEVLDAVAALRYCDPRTRDLVVSAGERMMCALMPFFLKARGRDATYQDARQFIVTDDTFGDAHVLFSETNARTKDALSRRPAIPIVTGYQGATLQGHTTTLGRGGSDYTATIIGGALDAEQVEIWTDVDGVMTADPRIVPSARYIEELSFEEAAEMAYFGAKVIHPLTLLPVQKKGIVVWIKNTLRPEGKGSRIVPHAHSSGIIRSIAARKGMSILTIEGTVLQGSIGFAGRMFSALGRSGINIVMISQASSEQSICCMVEAREQEAAQQALKEEFSREFALGEIQVSVRNHMCVIAVVGDGMIGTVGVAGRVFGALGKNKVNILAIAQGSSERNISLVVEEKNMERAVRAVHAAFFEEE